MKRKQVLLGVTGSIAAYKAVDLARLLKKQGTDVQAILTSGAQRFVTPLTFEAITGRTARTSVWSMGANEARKIEHVEDAYAAEQIVVAPASANFLARYANGLADDALTATLLSTTAPVFVAPAMETQMWRHPATRTNVATLRERGVRFLGPETGALASGRSGEGRMWAPEQIVRALDACTTADFEGITVLVTAGPTWEPIDPVRFLSNRSTGAMGIALATAAAERGASVRLVLGPTHLAVEDRPGLHVQRVETAAQMLAAAQSMLDGTQVLIASAAVSDYRPQTARPSKLKRSDPAATQLVLAENPDILSDLSTRLRAQAEDTVVVGFAAETEDLVSHARDKLRRKGCHLVIANEVGPGVGFGSGQTQVVAVPASGAPTGFGPADKRAVADFVLDQVLELRRQREGS